MKRRLKNFFKPNIVSISLFFLCFGIVWGAVIPLIGWIRAVPCRIYEESFSHIGLCPINPTIPVSKLGTYYLGFSYIDHLYGILYVVIFGLFVPYTMSCTIFQIYFKYIKKISNR